MTFLPLDEGGRQHLPGPPFTSQYRPHLVVQSPDIRQADGNEDYLGVCFLDGPSEYSAGQADLFILGLMYPEVDYSALCEGATFTVREGLVIVGFGKVMSRLDAR